MKAFPRTSTLLAWIVTILLAVPAPGSELSMTFDSTPQIVLPFGETYVENGMIVTSYSNWSEIGDPLGWNPTGNALYLHGTNEYVEIRMLDGSGFDLDRFDLLTNGYTNSRWIETSTGAVQYLPGVHLQNFTFATPDFQYIEWVKIGTPWFATEVDNIGFTPRGPIALTVLTQSLPVAFLNEAFNEILMARYGTEPYTWSVADGALPAGVVLGADGILSGVPSEMGSFSFTARVSDAIGTEATQLFTLVIERLVCAMRPPGSIAWWSFDETSGTTAADHVGNHPGSYAGDPLPVDGHVRGAIRLDGNSYINVADSDLWALGTSDFTIELWANFDTPGSGTTGEPGDILIGNDEGPGNVPKWFFALGGGVLEFVSNGTGFLLFNPFTPTPGRWYHLALVRQGTNFTAYVNGQPAGSATSAGAIPNPSAPLTIGQAEQIGFMNGEIDEVTLYRRALDRAELVGIVNAHKAGKCTDLKVSPTHGGNSEEVSIVVTGGSFPSGTSIQLERAGETPRAAESSSTDPEIGTVRALFDLTDAAVGEWDVVIAPPASTPIVIPLGFTVEASNPPDVWASVVGLGLIRPGRPQTFTVFFGNRSNVDALAVPVWIAGIPIDATVSLGSALATPDFPADVDWTQVPITLQRSSDQVLALIVPRIRAGGTGAVSFSVTTAGVSPFTLKASAAPPLLPDIETGAAGLAAALSGGIDITSGEVRCLGALADLALNLIPGGTCSKEVVRFFVLQVRPAISAVQDGSVLSMSQLISATFVAPWGLGKCIGDIPVVGAVARGLGVALDVAAVYEECREPLVGLHAPINLQVASVTSFDPNDKTGSIGKGPNRVVSGNAALGYVISFENIATASAPAQEVRITDDLDTTVLDLDSLTLGPITFGHRIVIPPSGLRSFSTDVDLRPDVDLIVRIRASLDLNTAQLNWVFTSIDPVTGTLPIDPLMGFLPPNQMPPEGQGTVSLLVSPRSGLPAGTQMHNDAVIVFDTNDPILTPDWLNTVGCPTAPKVCGVARKSTLLVKKNDKFVWKWINGDPTSQAEFGDPTMTADYSLCIYAGPSSRLIGAAVIPSNATEWSVLGTKGYKYKDPSGAEDGITGALLKGSATANKTKALVKGKGVGLPGITLPVIAPVMVQLINGDSGQCWGASYSDSALLNNDETKLKAKTSDEPRGRPR